MIVFHVMKLLQSRDGSFENHGTIFYEYLLPTSVVLYEMLKRIYDFIIFLIFFIK